MNARRRTPPRPRAAPHPFRRDWSVALDHRGRPTCQCGSLSTASAHRVTTIPAPRLDTAALAAGERDDDEEADRSERYRLGPDHIDHPDAGGHAAGPLPPLGVFTVADETATRETSTMGAALADLTHLDGRPAGRVYRARNRVTLTLALALVAAIVVGVIAGLAAALAILAYTWIAP